MSQKYFCFAILLIFANLSKFRCEKTNESENPIEVIKYKISINFNKANLKETHFFEGVADIIFKNYNLKETINLYGKYLFFKKIHLYGNESQLITGFHDKNSKSDNFTGVLTLNVTSKLEKNAQYTLRFWYTGKLNAKEEDGFYRSTYENQDLKRFFWGVINLTPNNARKVFPCFDETKYPAEFDWEMIYPKGYFLLSPIRFPQRREDNEIQRSLVEIKSRVLPQSLAFVFICSGRFYEISENDLSIAFLTSEVRFPEQFVLKIFPEIINFLYYKTMKLRIVKPISLVAIPDFAGCPIGNGQFLIFRESDFVWYDKASSEYQKQHILKTVTKAFFHAWLMDLGITNCLDGPVLKGLETFLEYHIANQIDPDFEFDKQFDIDYLFTFLAPGITPPVPLFKGEKPNQLFTSDQEMKISEYLSATFFRKMAHDVGFDNFPEALNKSLFHCDFEPKKLYDFIPDVELKFDNVMAKWTMDWRSQIQSSMNFENWIYEVDLSRNLESKVTLRTDFFESLNEINRARYVDSLFTMTRYGRISYSEFFYFCRYLKNDTTYYTWKVAFSALSSILEVIQNETKKTQFQEFVRDLIQPVYKSVLEDESDKIFILKEAMVHWYACKFGFEDCIRRAVDKFAAYKTHGIKPDKNLRQSVYCYGLKYSKDVENDWNFLWSELLKTKVQSEADVMIKSLGCVSDVQILRKYLQQAIASDSPFMRSDVFSIISAVYEGSPEGVEAASWFYFHHYHILYEYYDYDAVVSMLPGLFKKVTTQNLIDKWKNFVIETDGNYATFISVSVSILFDRKLWLDKKRKEIEEELDEFFNTKYKLI